jgi:phospholipid/cholesterol/gamma-HCH transport system ATP-binding protein
VTARKLDELVRNIRDSFGTTIVIVSHELSSIFGLADRVIMLNRDRQGIIAEGPPRVLAETSTDPKVIDFLAQGR